MRAPPRWSSVDRLFAQALEQPPDARAAFVDAECGTDNVLRDEVLSLLRAHVEAGEFLEGPPPAESHPLAAPPILTPGTRLGAFEIKAHLGTGGMGTVYHARDLRLDRSVALKVLAPRAGLAGTQRERLEREARAISRLAHPHICTLYDIGHSDAPSGDGATLDFLVMELLRGKTLDAVLAAGPLPTLTAVRYAAEIADALASAHAEGIVHRDLKPQNVMVTASGIKLLDFGLASISVPSLAPPVGQSPLTHPGLMIGTVQYMAPEQIEGQEADARADLFSLGLVLYEMLTGSRAFDRPTIVETLHAVLHDEAPALPDRIPAGLATIVGHCLEKDRERRFQSARDLAFALKSLALLPVAPPAAAVPSWRRWAPIGSAGIALGAAGALLATALASRTPVVTAHSPKPFAVEAVPEMQPAWSADGKSIAYVRFNAQGNQQIVVRSADSTVTTALTAGEPGAWHPFWARDGSRIFFGEGQLQSVDVTSGNTRVEVPDALASDVSPDGRTLAVWRMTLENERRIWTLWFGEQSASLRKYDGVPVFGSSGVPSVVRFSPDGSTILLWLAGDTPGIWLLPFPPAAAQPPRRLFGDSVGEVSGADWMPDSRHVVFSAKGALVVGDTQTGEVRPLLTSTAWLAWPAISPAGDRVLFTEDRSDHDVVELSLSGGPPRVVVGSSINDGSATWSPDGRRLAFVTDRRGPDEIWTRDAEGIDRPLVTPGDFPGPPFGRIMSVRYSPDGERLSLVTLASEPGGKFLTRLWVVPSHGGTPRPLLPGDARTLRATWSPDGRSLAIRQGDDGGIWAVNVDTALPPRPILRGPDIHMWHLEWSPTGDLIAGEGFTSPGRTPHTMVFAPDGTGLRALPALGNTALLWSKDGRTIYGTVDIDGVSTLRAVDVASGQIRTVANYGTRLALGEPMNDTLQFRLTPDGTGFLATVYNNRSDIWMLDGLTPPQTRGWKLW